MPGPLLHEPADVIRQLIIDLGRGVDYVDDQTSWAVFDNAEPDLPDDCITVYGSQSVDFGRVSVTGERQEMHGFQVRIRSKVKNTAFAKARDIAVAFDSEVVFNAVQVDDTRYVVQSVKRNGDPMFIGYDTPRSKRSVYTLNCLVSLRDRGEIEGDLILQENGGYLLLE